MNGSISLTPLELLALAALPLSAISKALKEWIIGRFVGQPDEVDESALDDGAR